MVAFNKTTLLFLELLKYNNVSFKSNLIFLNLKPWLTITLKLYFRINVLTYDVSKSILLCKQYKLIRIYSCRLSFIWEFLRKVWLHWPRRKSERSKLWSWSWKRIWASNWRSWAPSTCCGTPRGFQRNSPTSRSCSPSKAVPKFSTQQQQRKNCEWQESTFEKGQLVHVWYLNSIKIIVMQAGCVVKSHHVFGI